MCWRLRTSSIHHLKLKKVNKAALKDALQKAWLNTAPKQIAKKANLGQ
jgi:hypothetical protein